MKCRRLTVIAFLFVVGCIWGSSDTWVADAKEVPIIKEIKPGETYSFIHTGIGPEVDEYTYRSDCYNILALKTSEGNNWYKVEVQTTNNLYLFGDADQGTQGHFELYGPNYDTQVQKNKPVESDYDDTGYSFPATVEPTAVSDDETHILSGETVYILVPGAEGDQITVSVSSPHRMEKMHEKITTKFKTKKISYKTVRKKNIKIEPKARSFARGYYDWEVTSCPKRGKKYITQGKETFRCPLIIKKGAPKGTYKVRIFDDNCISLPSEDGWKILNNVQTTITIKIK